jgi:hypothetical protein
MIALPPAPRLLAAMLALAPLAACQAPPVAPATPIPPTFLERSRQDCTQGDKDACRMIQALSPPPKPKPLPPTQTQKNVDAILQGMARARADAPPTGAQTPPPPATPVHDTTPDGQPIKATE